MEPLIDWVSFTIPVPLSRKGDPEWLDDRNVKICRRQTLSWLTQAIGIDTMKAMLPELSLNEEPGRFPYRYMVVDNSTNVRIYFDGRLEHFLVEVSGRGCKRLQEQGQIVSLLEGIHSRVTRLDLSCDMDTLTTPIEFAKAGYAGKFTASSVHQSESGQTVYVGSSKSDLQACIYRYADPHPRAHLLRVEHRFRRDAAKAYGKLVTEQGLTNAVLAAGERFGWRSPLWNVDDISAVQPPKVAIDAKDSNVARWLLTQVFPAMRRYEREGTIPDLKAFVQAYLFEDDHTD